MQELARISIRTLNIRYLAWQKDQEPGNWSGVLHKKAGIPKKRAQEILDGSPLSPQEEEAIMEGFGEEKETLRSAPLLGMTREEILIHNIKYLRSRLPPKGIKVMAGALGIAQGTISRWISGKNTPGPDNVRQLLNYFGLDTSLSLSEVPLFLSSRPIGQFAQRAWLEKRLKNLPAEDLTELFPALAKLLRTHEDH